MRIFSKYAASSSEYYEVINDISEGKKSVVILKAYSPVDDHVFAIKVFSKSRVDKLSSHFIQEQSSASDLSHPHIVGYHKFCPEAVLQDNEENSQECSMIVMDHVPYGDMSSFISQRPFSEKLARTLFKQMLSAIDYLHNQKNIAHIDIKPENILMSSHGVKLIDFDFSQNSETVLSESVRGTLGYRSPELARGEVKCLKAVDIYSLGIVLFCMVTGYPPYNEIDGGEYEFSNDKYYKSFRENRDEFWQTHERLRKVVGRKGFSSSFRELIDYLLEDDAAMRPEVQDIMKMSWCEEEVFEYEKLETELAKYID